VIGDIDDVDSEFPAFAQRVPCRCVECGVDWQVVAVVRTHIGALELALVREKEIQRGNKNRATLAVARKLVTYMLAVERRQQDFVPAEEMAGKAVA